VAKISDVMTTLKNNVCEFVCWFQAYLPENSIAVDITCQYCQSAFSKHNIASLITSICFMQVLLKNHCNMGN
jgi:hypothetical protein